MRKKVWYAIGIFVLLILPLVALSFLAYTVFHQIIFLIGVSLFGWLAFYLSTLIGERDRLGREVFLQAYELKKSKEALDSCLATGPKGQVYRERLLESRLSEECERARRYRRPLSLLLVAADSFSQGAGPSSGSALNEVVQEEVAQLLKECTRTVDIVIRYGGNRSVVILPETQLDQARIVGERIRYVVGKKAFRIEGKEVNVHVSVGFISFDPALYRGKEDLLSALERALAEAKKLGTNRIATLRTELE